MKSKSNKSSTTKNQTDSKPLKLKLPTYFISLISTLCFGQVEKDSFWSPYIESDRIKVELKHYDSLNFEKAFRIWTEYQVVELIEFTDSIYTGTLTNFVTKNPNKKNKETLYQRIKIPKTTVVRLFKKLQSENIETLRDCSEVENYIIGLDGKTYVFEIGSATSRRVYSYWEPENDSYQNPEIQEVQNVRAMLNAINNEFNLWQYFKAFRDRLPKGIYSYGMIYMTKS